MDRTRLRSRRDQMSPIRILLFLIATAACAGGDMDAPPPVPTPEPLVVLDAGVGQPTVTVGDAVFDVESVSTPEQRAKGLSGRDYLADTSGMLFVFESGRTTSFWMKDMRFPLDFVWIGDQCTVVDTHSDVPAPSPTSASGSLPRYSSTTPSRYTPRDQLRQDRRAWYRGRRSRDL